MTKATTRWRLDPFMLSMIAAIALAMVAPRLGASGGVLPLAPLVSAGIALVFFLHGAALSTDALRAGASNWRLHLLVQASTFVLFPLIGGCVYLLGAHWLGAEVRLAFFFLCALPSTVSTSVAMTAVAGGNVPAAVFNATLSNLFGMILTPALMTMVSVFDVSAPSLGQAILAIAGKLLLPFLAGHVLRGVILPALTRHRRLVGLLDRCVILLIVYTAFCDSIQQRVWSGRGAAIILPCALLSVALVVAAFTLTTLVARRFGFSQADEITAVFCGSKKSLASGAPIARILMGSHPSLGVIMLPLMFYHQLQLFVAAVLARRYAHSRSS